MMVQAMRLKDFNSQPDKDQSTYVAMGADNPPTTKAVVGDAASTNKPPMVIQNPDGTLTVQKEPPKERAKDTEAKRDWSYPLRLLFPQYRPLKDEISGAPHSHRHAMSPAGSPAMAS